MVNDICQHCGWPKAEHELLTMKCPDYMTSCGWLETVYENGDDSNA